MIRSLSIAGLAGAALLVASHATAETKAYDLSGFNGIDASAGVNVSFQTGSAYAVTVENNKGDFSDLELRVKGDTLIIGRKSKNWGGWGKRENYNVTVSAPTLSFVEASSGSDVSGTGLSGEEIRLKVSSGADLDVSGIQGGSVWLKSSSGSDLDASGTCQTVRADSSSGSDIEARDLICTTGYAEASSGSDTTIFASQSVEADASSGADIDVYGGPTNTDTDKSSGGSVSIKG